MIYFLWGRVGILLTWKTCISKMENMYLHYQIFKIYFETLKYYPDCPNMLQNFLKKKEKKMRSDEVTYALSMIKNTKKVIKKYRQLRRIRKSRATSTWWYLKRLNFGRRLNKFYERSSSLWKNYWILRRKVLRFIGILER